VLADRKLLLEVDSQKLFRVDYCVEAQRDDGVRFRRSSTTAVMTKGDAIAAGVQAKIALLEEMSRDHKNVSFMVVNVFCEGETKG
jgi:hypothetical protein